jgi:adenosine deaminase
LPTSSIARPPCDASDRVPASRLLADSLLLAKAIDAWSMRNWRASVESGADHFFATFDKTAAVGNAHLGQMLAEVTARAARQNVSYLELMINADDGALPRLGLRVAWTDDLAAMRSRLDSAGIRQALSEVSRVLDRAEQGQRDLLRCGTANADAGCLVTVRYIYQAIRTRRPEQVFAQIYGGFLLPAIDKRYVSFNLVGPEHNAVATRDFALHMRMIEHLRASHARVPLTLHAGEVSEIVAPRSSRRSHIRESVEVAGARRIGHGVDILEEDDAEGLLRTMASRRVAVEVGLTSNDVILGVKGRAHPLATYLSRGVPVVLVTDDEGVSLSDLTREYFRAVTEHQLDYRALKGIVRNSIEFSFVDDITKSRLRAALDTAFLRFERRRD